MNASTPASVHEATATTLAGIEDPATRLATAAGIASRARKRVYDVRDSRNIALAVMHFWRGHAKADCYRIAGTDRRTFNEALDRLPGAVAVDPTGSRRYAVTIANPAGRPISAELTQQIAGLLQVAPGGPRNMSARVSGKQPGRRQNPQWAADTAMLKWTGELEADASVSLAYTVDFPADESAIAADPGLRIVKLAGADTAMLQAGDRCFYKVTACNATRKFKRSASFTEKLPAGYSGDAVASHSQVSVSGGSLTWAGDLYPGQSVSVVYSVTAAGGSGPVVAVSEGILRELDAPAGFAASAAALPASVDLVEAYGRLLVAARTDDLLALYVRLLDASRDRLVDYAERMAGRYNAKFAMWKTAQQVRDQVSLGLMSGEYDGEGEWTNAEVARATGLTTAAVAQLRTGNRNPKKKPIQVA